MPSQPFLKGLAGGQARRGASPVGDPRRGHYGGKESELAETPQYPSTPRHQRLSQTQSSQSSLSSHSTSHSPHPSLISSLPLYSTGENALPPPPSYTAEPPLSFQQQAVLDRIMDGESLFITGPAGTGKSVLIRSIIRQYCKREIESGEPLPELPVPKSKRARTLGQRRGASFSRLAVTASTGKAAE